MTESERNKRTIANAGILFDIWEKLYGFDAAMDMAVEDAKDTAKAAKAARIEQERLAAQAKAARPRPQVIAADSDTVRDLRRCFIHDGHDPRRHSLGT
jgi:hypothetical protein